MAFYILQVLEHLLVELYKAVVVGVRLGLLVDLVDYIGLGFFWFLGVGIQILVLVVGKKALFMVILKDLKTSL